MEFAIRKEEAETVGFFHGRAARPAVHAAYAMLFHAW
jgi:hypothetical protein